MYIEFENLPDHARVWIYQSERSLTSDEVAIAENMCMKFIDQWTAHQRELQGSAQILDNRFLVLAVDENVHGASGCSIDSSVRFIEELGRKINTSFLDRRVPVYVGNELEFLTTTEIKELSNLGEITENSIFFNNLVPDLGQFKASWKVKVKDGWLKRFIVKKQTVL